MTYTQLLQGIAFSGTVPQGEVAGVAQDSRKAQAGWVFVCVEGRTSDGHAFAQKALEQGAGLIVSERPLGLAREIQVADTRAVYARLCANFFGRPAEKLTLVGVTGTNGKTSVSTVLKNLLAACGVTCGLIGTVRSEIDTVEIPAKFTTPEAWDLHALLARMVAAGCTHCVMEASSQALEQGRLAGLRFDLAVFTNLSRDHLDYHGTMEAYFAAKRILFANSDVWLVNADDEWGRQLLAGADNAAHSYSAAGTAADYSARDVRLGAAGVRFALLAGDELLPVRFGMPGEYSVANALAALGAAALLGIPLTGATTALAQTGGVPGRCEVLYSGGFTVIRDFAHTGDALENLLAGLKPFVKGRLVVLFGPAGMRDATKRPAMGRAAATYGDVVYLTADNPRAEPLEQVFADTLPAIEALGTPVVPEPDRGKAIAAALQTLAEGDVLVLAGKGHEDYQALDGRTIYFNEGEIVARWLAARGLFPNA